MLKRLNGFLNAIACKVNLPAESPRLRSLPTQRQRLVDCNLSLGEFSLSQTSPSDV
jgi:hypothetical protein